MRARKDCRLCSDGGPSPLRNGSSEACLSDELCPLPEAGRHARPARCRMLAVGCCNALGLASALTAATALDTRAVANNIGHECARGAASI